MGSDANADPVEHLADEAINTVTLVDDALRDARAGITDPAQLAIFEQEAQEYARRLVEGETTGWEGVLDELANALTTRQAWRIVRSARRCTNSSAWPARKWTN